MDSSTIAFRRKLSAWGRQHRRSFPWRETQDPFRILLAEVLLQRSRGVTVAKVYEALFVRWSDEEQLARARVQSIAAVIRPLGLVKRAETIRALARKIVELGGVPRDHDSLLSLPGVGRYAAGATMAVAFDQPVPVVDGVTARVYRRFFGRPETGPATADAGLWELAREATPDHGSREWNWAVLDLAATVCLPKVPRCGECPLATECAWSQAASS